MIQLKIQELFGFILVVGCLVGCKPTLGDQNIVIPDESVPKQIMTFPTASHESIVWFPNERLFVHTTIDDSQRFFTLLESQWEEVVFQPDPRCETKISYGSFMALPDGRLGLQKECIFAPGKIETTLLAYDWASETLSPVVLEPLPDLATATFSWNPDMSQGVQGSGAGYLFSTIFWLSPQEAKPMNIIVEAGRSSWSLADNYWGTIHREVVYDAGLADSPRWSPDGNTIVFFATPDAYGRRGTARLTSPWIIYQMDSKQLQPMPIVEGIYYPFGLEWSPDGKWLAFSGREDLSDEDKLWLFSVESQSIIPITSGDIKSIAWSPDGSQMAAIVQCNKTCSSQDPHLLLGTNESLTFPPPCEDEYLCRREIIVFDIAKLVISL